jgi:catechol 2,3-dioxygenase-like lactoylglutathione lyase family enzyme
MSTKAQSVEMRLEIVVAPVSDVDRAKRFYGGLGWRLDADFAAGDDFRVIQFTPPGSACSVIFGKNVTAAAPGSARGLYLIVSDIEAARTELFARGVELSEPFHDAGDAHAGADEPYLFGRIRVAGPDPEHRSYRSFASFTDRDGTAGCSRKSPRDCPDAWTRRARHSPAQLSLQWRSDAPRPHTASTRRGNGQRDENWPAWYAEHIVREQAGRELPT